MTFSIEQTIETWCKTIVIPKIMFLKILNFYTICFLLCTIKKIHFLTKYFSSEDLIMYILQYHYDMNLVKL